MSSADLSAVKLFPLPNVVLFPRAVLPLHIFEERYKTMVSDAIDEDLQIAMALLAPGWEKDYHGTAAAVEPVCCAGTILTWEQLDDGKYNLLLQGHTRARIVGEQRRGTYRVAQLEPIVETPVMEIDLSSQRQQLIELFSDDVLGATSAGRQFHQILLGTMPTADVADLLAFNLFDDIPLKQALLAEADVVRRIDRVIAELQLHRAAELATVRRSHEDPSMN